jgi:hypothetical protein
LFFQFAKSIKSRINGTRSRGFGLNKQDKPSIAPLITGNQFFLFLFLFQRNNIPEKIISDIKVKFSDINNFGFTPATIEDNTIAFRCLNKITNERANPKNSLKKCLPKKYKIGIIIESIEI